MSFPYPWIAGLALALLTALLFFEKKDLTWGKALSKLLLSSMFVGAALAAPNPLSSYSRPLLAGLVFCLAGDLLLAFPAMICFRLGLIAFLIGHLFYAAAFLPFLTVGAASLAALPVTAAAALFIYRGLSPHLGDMKVPVIAYIAIISVMTYLAFCAALEPRLSKSGGILIFGGAALFYLSDLFVARNRFIKKAFINRLIGPPLYYGGQFMLAFSVWAVTS
jgi:uncharacterized membrane protein YhhN